MAIINGTSAPDTLIGTNQADIIDGKGAADLMIGLDGDDTYIVNVAGDRIVEEFDQGTDTVQSSASYTLSEHVENLTLTGSSSLSGTGNAGDNVITGNSGSNTLRGMDGDDTLYGGSGSDTLEGGEGWDMLDGGSGGDTMCGGRGSDTYFVNSTSDVVIDPHHEDGGGHDTVYSTVTFTLGSGLEDLILTGASNANGTGNEDNNYLEGNDGNNTLRGNAGDDILDGGAGVDTLRGGGDNDIYYVSEKGDTVFELEDEGFDEVYSSVSFTLGAHVESLILEGGRRINGTGNDLDNFIMGNDGNNILDGRAGADFMSGGLGDDIYIVDDEFDEAFEEENGFDGGVDLVRATASHTLMFGVENLTLMGTAAYDGGGNELDNTIRGNSAGNLLQGHEGDDNLYGGGGNDILQGGDGWDLLDGGAGVDQMYGGGGNDTYVVSHAADFVGENADEGHDFVQSAISYTLGNHLEGLLLFGSDDLNATGNALDNTLSGNAGDNRIEGAGGADRLFGEEGADTFVFATALGPDNVDRIEDFSSAEGDRFELDRDVFSALDVGTLQASQFVIGTAATTAAQRIVYDEATGSLYYDADGSGAETQTLFADAGPFGAGPALNAGDFAVVA